MSRVPTVVHSPAPQASRVAMIDLARGAAGWMRVMGAEGGSD